MLERLVENWLDSANERSFQGPFCQMLAAKGYTVLHLTRHGEMEMGKDVIAQAPDGTYCAYQLKSAPGPRITLTQWKNEVQAEVISLVTQPLVHPSVPEGSRHRSYLVTNRGLDDPVARAIDDHNRAWKRSKLYRLGLRTIVRGELLQMATELRTGLWPTEQRDANSLLHMYLADGRGSLPLRRLATLLETTLGIDEDRRLFSVPEKKRRLASAALLCFVALSNYTLANNYVREIEGLTMLMAYILAHAERHELPSAVWESEFRIAEESIYDRLLRLQQELSERSHLIEGAPWADTAFLGARVTMLLGYMGLLGLWREARGDKSDSVDDQIRDFCDRYRKRAEFWGESATPFFLALFWYLEQTSGSMVSDLIVRDLLIGVCGQNHPRSNDPLPNPYYSFEEVITSMPGLGGTPIKDHFAGRSCSATGLLHLIVRRNLKQSAKLAWPEYSRLMHEEHVPRPAWRFYLWRDQKGGKNRMVYPPLTKKWQDLRADAADTGGRGLPRLIRKRPELLLLLLLAYPHRAIPRAVRWIDGRIGKSWD